jgi:citrate lyase subunit beta/citryl-CoA lyase
MEANRTYLFCPGNHPRKVEKVFGSGTDVVIIDLEDAVAISEKPATRAVAVEALKLPRSCRGYVRVNAYDTEFCYGDICEIVGPWLDGIVLPKLESVDDLRSVDWLVGNLEREHEMEIGSIDIMPIIETAKGQDAARDIARAGTRIKRLSFGAGDYTKDLGMEWSLAETELASMRAEMVVASRVGELEPPIDTVFIHIREHEAFLESCNLVRDLGFQGKLCIHPDQVSTANGAFTPTEEQLVFAHKVIDAFAEAEAAGSASIQIDGYFVDYPIVDKAQRIVDVAEAIARAEAA